MLDAKLRDHLRQRANMFAEATPALGATLQRPLLALFDRNFDLAAGLQHGWSYKPLVQDVLGLKLNRVTLQARLLVLPTACSKMLFQLNTYPC